MDPKLKSTVPKESAPLRKAPEDPKIQIDRERDKLKAKSMKFTGIAFTFIYRPHLGFADYAIAKLKLENGVVVEVEDVSDPLAAFEARAHMETKQAYHLEKMQRAYPPEYQHV